MVADDCILYYNGNNWLTICDIMQQDLDKFVVWGTNNRLRLNESRTQSMIVGSCCKLSQLENPSQLTITGKYIKHVTHYNYVAIVLDSELSLTPLCKNIEKLVTDQVYML